MTTKTNPYASTNPWTQQQLANDYHYGDRREAMLIALENGQEPPIECSECGGEAYYKNTVGTEKCTACGKIRVEWIEDASGRRHPRFA